MKKEQDFNNDDELLVKYITGMADVDEQKQALSWIRLNKENTEYFYELRDVYEASKLVQPNPKTNVELSWEKVKARHYKNKALKLQKGDFENARLFRLELMKYAALILFIITLGIIGYKFTANKSVHASTEIWNTIEAPFGSRARLTLADGTKVWLNAGSQLKYSSKFAQQNRKVYLVGEAYFDVVRDESKQFVVSTSHLNIRVFGTQFNVKAYNEENIIQTTLVKGSVTIEGKGLSEIGHRKVVLKPNEIATYYISNKKSITLEKPVGKIKKKATRKENLEILTNINPIVFTSWKDSRWLIDGEPLSSLAVKLERRYNVKITIDTKELQDYKFRGTIKDETLEQVLNVIKLSAPINYNIKNNEVNLIENKSFKNSYDELLIKNK